MARRLDVEVVFKSGVTMPLECSEESYDLLLSGQLFKPFAPEPDQYKVYVRIESVDAIRVIDVHDIEEEDEASSEEEGTTEEEIKQ